MRSKLKYYCQLTSPIIILMWRTVGTLSSPINKSKDESVFEPFGHASKLKLNQSQLSGDCSPYFMQHYFSKKRSMESIPRSHSQKSIELLQFHSPSSSSLRNIIASPPKKNSEDRQQGKKEPSINSLKQKPANEPSKDGHSNPRKCLSSLRELKEDYKQLRKNLQEDFIRIKSSMQDTEGKIICKFKELEFSQETKKKQGVNPQVLSRIRHESYTYNERIRNIEERKAQVRDKYRQKKMYNAG